MDKRAKESETTVPSYENMYKYANVLVRRGVNLQPGQMLYIEAPTEHEYFVSIVAKAAYDAGASNVGVVWKSDLLDLVKLSQPEMPENTLLPCDYGVVDYFAGKGAAFLRLESPNLTTFANVPADRIQKKAVADREIRVRYGKLAQGAGQSIAAVPSAGWAKAVFPDLPEQQAVEKLWDCVLSCTRCMEPDPIAAWDEFIRRTNERKRILNEKKYVTFHYKSAKTDLMMSPIDDQSWGGGCIEVPGGKVYTPNVPTEEVFTVPHKYKVNGVVCSTMPLNFRGKIVDDFRLVLKDGKVVEYSAAVGEDILKSILETDEGSCYFGEMALVDQRSPIARQGVIFYSTLYDENASCHIALGLAGAPNMTDEEREAKGINHSILHVDFMVGSDDMSIRGQKQDGTWEDVFVNGRWAW